MRQLRRASLTLLVWLTAAMTLVAGTPHFTCRCPDGRVKPYCFGSQDKKTGCCCGGDCCGNARGCCGNDPSDQQAAAPTCCGHRAADEEAVGPEKTGHPVPRGCCTRGLARPEPTSPPSSHTSVVKDTAFGLPLAPDGPRDQHCVAAASRQTRHHERPPPTDLVIALQHFLI